MCVCERERERERGRFEKLKSGGVSYSKDKSTKIMQQLLIIATKTNMYNNLQKSGCNKVIMNAYSNIACW